VRWREGAAVVVAREVILAVGVEGRGVHSSGGCCSLASINIELQGRGRTNM
jgi:hypothetical protein